MAGSPSSLGFNLMSLGFKFRDFFKPRGQVLKEAGITSGAYVLDFGCGPGGYILPLVKLIGSEGKIYALDSNPQAIRAVEDTVSKNNLSNVTTIVSDGATGLPDASLDFVLLYDVLHHLKNLETILAELHRVLKDDGVFSMSDHHMKDEDIKRAVTASGLFQLLKRGEKVFNFAKVIQDKS